MGCCYPRVITHEAKGLGLADIPCVHVCASLAHMCVHMCHTRAQTPGEEWILSGGAMEAQMCTRLRTQESASRLDWDGALSTSREQKSERIVIMT